jgi:hypothetical protein
VPARIHMAKLTSKIAHVVYKLHGQQREILGCCVPNHIALKWPNSHAFHVNNDPLGLRVANAIVTTDNEVVYEKDDDYELSPNSNFQQC